MRIHSLLRPRSVLACVGIAFGAGLGIALAASPIAVADAIDDAWPYLATSSEYFPYYEATGLPSHAAESYTEQITFSDTPYLYDDEHQVVTALLDGSAFPNVGTVEDDVYVLPVIPEDGGLVGAPLFANSYLDDPKLGFADAFSLPGLFNPGFGITDTYLSDAAGIKDVLNVYGLPPLTLFEFPAADPGAATLDMGQLMTEFSTLF
jgi:hypothetical protein